MSPTIIGLIVLVVGVAFSVVITPKDNPIKKPGKSPGQDIYSGDREF